MPKHIGHIISFTHMHLPLISSYNLLFRNFVRRLRTINGQPPILIPPTAGEAYSLLTPPRCRPRPLYFMPQGNNSILPPSTLAKLSLEDTEHPRIRKHKASCLAIEYFHLDFHPRPEHHLTHNRVPHQLIVLCDHYNNNYLIRPTDMKISPIQLWRIIYRRSFSHLSSHPMPITTHQAIYIQQRHSTPDEMHLFTQKRRKPTCHRQIGEDYSTLLNNTTIAQPDGINLMYLATDLHCRTHGSVDVNDMANRDFLFDVLRIEHAQINPKSAAPSGLQVINNVFVAYKTNKLITNLDRQLVCGLSRLHHDLTTHLLKGCKTDPSRMHGKVVEGETSLNLRIRFGFGRVQRSSIRLQKTVVKTWTLNGTEMPTIQYRTFTSLPCSLQQQLFKVFESAQIFVEGQLTNPFPNKLRSNLCVKKLNTALGFPFSRSKFEYFDIVLSRNSVLPKHIDSKNDSRPGYNFCAVYSFYQVILGLEYKVSIIMTTRSTVGAALERTTKK